MNFEDLPVEIRKKIGALLPGVKTTAEHWESLPVRTKLRLLQLVQLEIIRDAQLLNTCMSELLEAK